MIQKFPAFLQMKDPKELKDTFDQVSERKRSLEGQAQTCGINLEFLKKLTAKTAGSSEE